VSKKQKQGLGEVMEKQTDIIETALAAGKFSTLAAALGAAGLIQTLKGDGPFTVFAPTDEAFSKIPAETLSDLLQPENKAKLTAILTYHVVSGRMYALAISNMESATTLQGQTLQFSKRDGVKINDATVLTADVEATNGVIHIIDAVLLPSAAAAA
jgi:uncharacterized surface protein with fasciclin (FAS1) repeats